MKAPPAPGDRPSLASARRTHWRSWLLQEWGLIILAGVLAVIIWEITSTNVIRELRIEDVRVKLVVLERDQDRVGAVLNEKNATVTLEMVCSERERRAVHEALTLTGGGVATLELQISPEITSDGIRRINPLDVWRWPVGNAAEIELEAERPDGRVYLIEGIQQVHIAQPPTIPDAAELERRGFMLQTLDPNTSASATIQVTPSFVEFRAPKAILGSSGGPFTMTPDPIDLTGLLAEENFSPGVIQNRELSFSRWINAADLATNDENEKKRVRNYRGQLPTVQASARFALQRKQEEPFQNRVEILLDPAFAWEFDGQSPDRLIREEVPARFEGELVGPADALREIREQPEKWHWAIWVDRPQEGWPETGAMANAEDNVRKGVRAQMVWVPLDPTWARRGVVFKPNAEKNEDQFFLKIEPRKPAGNGG